MFANKIKFKKNMYQGELLNEIKEYSEFLNKYFINLSQVIQFSIERTLPLMKKYYKNVYLKNSS